MPEPSLQDRIVKALAAMLWEERFMKDWIVSEKDYRRILEEKGLKAMEEEE